MLIETTLFNLTTMQPYTQVVQPAAVCGHCRHLVTIRNDAGHCWHYCGITECTHSIIGCRPTKMTSRGCSRFSAGSGEFLTANRLFTTTDKQTPGNNKQYKETR